jgi:hypothetical protein
MRLADKSATTEAPTHQGIRVTALAGLATFWSMSSARRPQCGCTGGGKRGRSAPATPASCDLRASISGPPFGPGLHPHPCGNRVHGALPPGGAVGRLDRRRIAPVAGSPRDARTRTLAGLQCRDVVVLARLSRPGRGSSEHCDVEARGGLRDRADSEVCRGSVAAEKAVPDPGAGWERRWRALLMRSPSVPSRIRPTKRPSDTLRM